MEDKVKKIDLHKAMLDTIAYAEQKMHAGSSEGWVHFTPEKMLAHIKDMNQRMTAFSQYDREKANRWVGWAQAACQFVVAPTTCWPEYSMININASVPEMPAGFGDKQTNWERVVQDQKNIIAELTAERDEARRENNLLQDRVRCMAMGLGAFVTSHYGSDHHEPLRTSFTKEVASTIRVFSSPTMGHGSVHGKEAGHIVYERSGLPFIAERLAKTVRDTLTLTPEEQASLTDTMIDIMDTYTKDVDGIRFRDLPEEEKQRKTHRILEECSNCVVALLRKKFE